MKFSAKFARNNKTEILKIYEKSRNISWLKISCLVVVTINYIN